MKVEEKCKKNGVDLEKIEIPSTLEYIGNNAFSGCTSLNDIVIPEGVTHIYEEAKEIYDKHLVEAKEQAEENSYTVETEDATTFDAGIFGEWDLNHTTLYIQGVN